MHEGEKAVDIYYTGRNGETNGSAMRVSAAGWLYDSLERTREVGDIICH